MTDVFAIYVKTKLKNRTGELSAIGGLAFGLYVPYIGSFSHSSKGLV
jgi:hypothetical protein